MSRHYITPGETQAVLAALEAYPMESYAGLSRMLGVPYGSLRKLAVTHGLEGLRGFSRTEQRRKVRSVLEGTPIPQERTGSRDSHPEMEQLDLGI